MDTLCSSKSESLGLSGSIGSLRIAIVSFNHSPGRKSGRQAEQVDDLTVGEFPLRKPGVDVLPSGPVAILATDRDLSERRILVLPLAGS